VLRKLSLRARLIVGVIALAAAGLTAADVITYASLRSFLISRTDSTLDSAHVSVSTAFGHGQPRDGAPGPDRGGNGPGGDHVTLASVATDMSRLTRAAPGVYVQVRRPNGTIVNSGELAGPTTVPPPKLPTTIAYTATRGGEKVAYFTVPATSGSDSYRVRASTETGYVLLVASSLHDVSTTLHRLLMIEGIVTLVVLVAIGLLGLWVVRLGLRPLTAIGATAATIAAGDLSQRVAREDTRTEVGRLGLALNGMLGQIETAFRSREASERKLRRFVADASHELRTPLAAVRAYAELFTRGAAQRPEDLARSMTGITRESERMSLLVEDLLLLARLDEGRPLESERVQLRDVVSDAVETAHTVEPGRPISCNVEDASVRGDRDRLRQIVDNLLANVRAHTPAGAPVAVSLTRADGSARISVADTGPGVDDEQLAHVFERFYRADASRARASGGVGLGLSIVSAVTEAHGGTVSATSSPGQGATFVIELPLDET
jgi:two-component system, OmpR family, sensor kinase